MAYMIYISKVNIDNQIIIMNHYMMLIIKKSIVITFMIFLINLMINYIDVMNYF